MINSSELLIGIILILIKTYITTLYYSYLRLQLPPWMVHAIRLDQLEMNNKNKSRLSYYNVKVRLIDLV